MKKFESVRGERVTVRQGVDRRDRGVGEIVEMTKGKSARGGMARVFVQKKGDSRRKENQEK